MAPISTMTSIVNIEEKPAKSKSIYATGSSITIQKNTPYKTSGETLYIRCKLIHLYSVWESRITIGTPHMVPPWYMRHYPRLSALLTCYWMNFHSLPILSPIEVCCLYYAFFYPKSTEICPRVNGEGIHTFNALLRIYALFTDGRYCRWCCLFLRCLSNAGEDCL